MARAALPTGMQCERASSSSAAHWPRRDRLSPEELESGFREAVAAVFSREATQRRSAQRRRILSRRQEAQT
jgi:hypothetical protein